MSAEPDPQARFAQSKGLEINQVPDGYVIYEQAVERVHFLNPTAALVFELCNGEYSVAEIQEIVDAAFDLTPRFENLAKNCIADLRREGLVNPCSR